MEIDIIICAIIAVILLARLWSVFGRRNEEDRQRPNPFITPIIRPRDNDAGFAGQAALPPAQKLLPVLKSAPASLAGGLEQVKELDAGFDEKTFLFEVKDAFKTIVEDFAKGDLNRITALLSPTVLDHFQKAIAARREAGQVMESRIADIRDAEVVSARVDNGQAILRVQFTSHQENILRDQTGQIIGGEAGALEEITDLWTFARDPKATPPRWLLVETSA